jgi:hypothetical protein
VTVCTRCHRPLIRASESGMGPVCTRKSKKAAVPAHERDLFGFDVDKAAHAAVYRLGVLVESLTAEALMAVKHQFHAARVRWGVWAK